MTKPIKPPRHAIPPINLNALNNIGVTVNTAAGNLSSAMTSMTSSITNENKEAGRIIAFLVKQLGGSVVIHDHELVALDDQYIVKSRDIVPGATTLTLAEGKK